MVNKQYTIQQHESENSPSAASSATAKFNFGTRHSPPPVRSISIISDAPNPQQPSATRTCDLSTNVEAGNGRQNEIKNLTTFGRNIAMFGDAPRPAERKSLKAKGDAEYEGEKMDCWMGQGRYEFKDLTINDIGRFQYILQMDREMGTNTDSLHRIPSRLPSSPASNSSTLNSSKYLKFWRSESESPITSLRPSSVGNRHRRHTKFYRYFKDFWKLAKWPLVLIISCLVLGVVTYLFMKEPSENVRLLEESEELIRLPSQYGDGDNILEDEDEITTHSILNIFMKNPSVAVATPTTEQVSTVGVRNTQKLKLIPKKVLWNDDDDDVQTNEAMKVIGFTSGHQNNFGIPIEEDERVLKLLNDELLKQQMLEEAERPSSTGATTLKINVSPTLPSKNYDSSTHATLSNTTDTGNCESTSLPICKGVLQYDLTMPAIKQSLTHSQVHHFQYLFESKCSPRATEFVCSILEPECRPEQMGVLQPCKRICKAILEPCASIIASSEILTIMFECDRYPDSSDRNVCEDPTRRKVCNENEFKCLDSTCIPKQWSCDNIKDCSLGEDEDECMFCDHEEFRCHSNDKCIPDKYRCDQFDDCSDGSDELDCLDYDDNVEYDYPNPRIYSFGSIQSPDSPNGHSYATIADELPPIEDENNTEISSFLPTSAPEIDFVIDNQTTNDTLDEDVQKGAASGKVLVGVSKILANFQDSKEIMMTSDSETDFKYSNSSANSTNTSTTTTTPVLAIDTTSETMPTMTVQPVELCPGDQLRCVSGKCITVEQLCDKIIDCPDGADEEKCVYKEIGAASNKTN